jgi:thymidylate kinase
MYIVVEGIISSGKTSLAKALSNRLECRYIKSLTSDTKFGSLVRGYCQDTESWETYFLYISDLLLDELRVRRLLNEGSLVRDKTYISSFAHFLVRNEGKSGCWIDILREAYTCIANDALIPDSVVLLNYHYDVIFRRYMGKTDKSFWDDELLSNRDLFEAQRSQIVTLLQENFAGRLLEFTDASLSTDSICDAIVQSLKE